MFGLTNGLVGAVLASQALLSSETIPGFGYKIFNLTVKVTHGDMQWQDFHLASEGNGQVFGVSHSLAGPGYIGIESFYINASSLYDSDGNEWYLNPADHLGSGDQTVAQGHGYGVVCQTSCQGEPATGLSVDEETGLVIYNGPKDFATFTVCKDRKDSWMGRTKLTNHLGWRNGSTKALETGCADVKLKVGYL